MRATSIVMVVTATAFGVGAFASLALLIHLPEVWIVILACLGGVGCTYLIEHL
jgi:hypothetical protein